MEYQKYVDNFTNTSSGNSNHGRGKFTLKEEQDICQRYRMGDSLTTIQRELNINLQDIYNVLKRHKIKLRKKPKNSNYKGIHYKPINDNRHGEIKVQPLDDLSNYPVKEEPKLKKSLYIEKDITKEIEEDICCHYMYGMTLDILSKKYNLTLEQIKSVLKNNDVLDTKEVIRPSILIEDVIELEKPSKDIEPVILNVKEQQIINSYFKNNKNMSDVLKLYKISQQTFYKILDKAGLERRGSKHISRQETKKITQLKFELNEDKNNLISDTVSIEDLKNTDEVKKTVITTEPIDPVIVDTVEESEKKIIEIQPLIELDNNNKKPKPRPSGKRVYKRRNIETDTQMPVKKEVKLEVPPVILPVVNEKIKLTNNIKEQIYNEFINGMTIQLLMDKYQVTSTQIEIIIRFFTIM